MLRSQLVSFVRLWCLSAFLLALGWTAPVRPSVDLSPELWTEYGRVQTSEGRDGNVVFTRYEMHDLTGALAAWEALRLPGSASCKLTAFCTSDPGSTIVASENSVFVFSGSPPTPQQFAAILNNLPRRHDSSLPAILTFLPKEGRIPNSARYILGPASLKAYAPELDGSSPGFEQGAEAQVAAYKAPGAPTPVRLAVFYYPTPEMARLGIVKLKQKVGANVKRSSVLVASVLGTVPDSAADWVLSRIGYEAKITWNDIPPPSPIKPLYQLLLNILYMSGLLSAICLTAGLLYAGSRLYRRKHGTLEADESMTVLKLTE